MRLQDSVRSGFEDGLQQPAVDLFAIHHQNGGGDLRIVIRFEKRNRRYYGRNSSRTRRNETVIAWSGGWHGGVTSGIGRKQQAPNGVMSGPSQKFKAKRPPGRF